MPTSVDSSAPLSGPRGAVAIAPVVCVAWMTLLGSHSVSGALSYDLKPDALDRKTVSRAASPEQLTALTEDPATSNRLRNLRLAALIESWLQDDSRDDERIGPLLDRFLVENPVRIGE